MRMRTVAILAAAGLGVAALAVVIVVLTPSRGRQSGLAAALAEWKSLGGKTTLAELSRPPLEPQHNAAVAYEPAFRLLNTIPESDLETLKYSDDLTLLRPLVARHEELFRLIETAAVLPECNWRTDYSAGLATKTPHLPKCRLMGLGLGARALVARADGDMNRAVRCCDSMFAIAEHCGAERGTVALLFQVACMARAIEILYKTLDDPILDLSPLASRLASADFAEATRQAILDEGTCGLAAFDDPRFAQANSVTMLGWNIERDKDYFLREMIRRVRLAEMPYWQAKPEIADRMPPRWALLSRVLLGAYDKAMQSAAVIEARRELALAAIALRQHRAEYGAYPNTFDMPIDPFTGKPLHYQREGDGFVIWSEGIMPGTDDERIEWRWN